jgi:SAM-dependent methyltransferase
MDERLMQAMLDVDEHHWWYRGRRVIIKAELERLPLPDRTQAHVLDAGCGSGRTLQELVPYGTVSGIELDPGAATVAKEHDPSFDVRIGRLEDLPWEDHTFDLITCLDVIEHTPDDRATLASLRRVTKPGGHLLVTVPAYQALWSRHDVANHHFRRYSRLLLKGAGVTAGWELERITSFNSLLLAPAAVVRLAQRKRGLEPNGDYTPDLHIGPDWLNGVLERPLQAEAAWLRRGGTLPAGLSLLGVFRNPANA